MTIKIPSTSEFLTSRGCFHNEKSVTVFVQFCCPDMKEDIWEMRVQSDLPIQTLMLMLWFVSSYTGMKSSWTSLPENEEN